MRQRNNIYITLLVLPSFARVSLQRREKFCLKIFPLGKHFHFHHQHIQSVWNVNFSFGIAFSGERTFITSLWKFLSPPSKLLNFPKHFNSLKGFRIKFFSGKISTNFKGWGWGRKFICLFKNCEKCFEGCWWLESAFLLWFPQRPFSISKRKGFTETGHKNKLDECFRLCN